MECNLLRNIFKRNIFKSAKTVLNIKIYVQAGGMVTFETIICPFISVTMEVFYAKLLLIIRSI